MIFSPGFKRKIAGFCQMRYRKLLALLKAWNTQPILKTQRKQTKVREIVAFLACLDEQLEDSPRTGKPPVTY